LPNANCVINFLKLYYP